MPAKNQEKYIQQTEKFFAKIQQAAVQLISVTFSGALSEMNENQHVTQNMIPVPQGQVCQKIKCKPKNSFFFLRVFYRKTSLSQKFAERGCGTSDTIFAASV